ncbi:MAG: hypothetical protein QOH13_2027 [Thermoleophilaceae bacterium]|jgi:hypothetical protein|nr:hypothetical protein [Thermoleophilaceae bacterium]
MNSLTAVVHLSAGRLQLVRHPADGRIVAFDDPDAAFAFAVTLEIAGAESAGTVGAPDGPVHMLGRGTSATEVFGHSTIEVAA